MPFCFSVCPFRKFWFNRMQWTKHWKWTNYLQTEEPDRFCVIEWPVSGKTRDRSKKKIQFLSLEYIYWLGQHTMKGIIRSKSPNQSTNKSNEFESCGFTLKNWSHSYSSLSPRYPLKIPPARLWVAEKSRRCRAGSFFSCDSNQPCCRARKVPKARLKKYGRGEQKKNRDFACIPVQYNMFVIEGEDWINAQVIISTQFWVRFRV